MLSSYVHAAVKPCSLVQFNKITPIITRNPKVIWEEPCHCPSRGEWTRLLHVTLAVQYPLQTSPITQQLVRY